MAAADTFRAARNTASGKQIFELSMAGRHLAAAHEKQNPLLTEIHRELADDHARAALMWRRVQADYDEALDAILTRAELASAELFWRRTLLDAERAPGATLIFVDEVAA